MYQAEQAQGAQPALTQQQLPTWLISSFRPVGGVHALSCLSPLAADDIHSDSLFTEHCMHLAAVQTCDVSCVCASCLCPNIPAYINTTLAAAQVSVLEHTHLREHAFCLALAWLAMPGAVFTTKTLHACTSFKCRSLVALESATGCRQM